MKQRKQLLPALRGGLRAGIAWEGKEVNALILRMGRMVWRRLSAIRGERPNAVTPSF
jgi:hypothetical protein